MVRTYKRKTDQGQWCPEKVEEAVEKVLSKALTIRRAAEAYNVPYTSLQRRVTCSRGVTNRRGGQQAMNEDGDRLVHLVSRGFGITPKAVRKYAFEYAERKNLKHNFNKNVKMAREDWFHRFMQYNYL